MDGHLACAESAHFDTGDPETVAERAPDAAAARAGEAQPADHFVSVDGKEVAGFHLIIDLFGARHLTDEARIRKAFEDCVSACGATLLHIHTHVFEPNGGVSGVAVLAESHISTHTWPEREYAAFDVFMCGDAEPHKAVDILARAFEAEDVKVSEILRGDGA